MKLSFWSGQFCLTYAPAKDQCDILKSRNVVKSFPRFPIVSVFFQSFQLGFPAQSFKVGEEPLLAERRRYPGGGWVEEGEEKERNVWRHPHSLAVSLSLLQGNIN